MIVCCSPSQTSAAASASTTKKTDSPDAKRPRRLSLTNPDDAIQAGWRLYDVGTVFRGLLAFLNLKPSLKRLTQPLLKKLGDGFVHKRSATCRNQITSIVFRGLFDNDKDAFKSYLQTAALHSTWSEGILIQAISEKLGRPVIIWKFTSDDTWLRYVISGRFSRGYACVSSGREPIV